MFSWYNLESFSFLKENKGAVNLGESEEWVAGMNVWRGGCGQDVLYDKHINTKKKENKYKIDKPKNSSLGSYKGNK